jgi:hypothetical protein
MIKRYLHSLGNLIRRIVMPSPTIVFAMAPLTAAAGGV